MAPLKFRAELMACSHVDDVAREFNRRQELQLVRVSVGDFDPATESLT